MSTEKHPNFHALKFVTEIMSSYYESLRGKANKKNCPDIRSEVLIFVNQIEEKIDSSVEGES